MNIVTINQTVICLLGVFFSVLQSPTRRRKMLSLRMKSFSLDAPESPKQIEEGSQLKSVSTTTFSTYACLGAPTSPESRRKKFGKRACSLEASTSSKDVRDGTESRRSTFQRMGSRTSSHKDSTHNSPDNSPNSLRRYIPSKLYVAMYNYKGKEKDDLDLRAGWRLSVIDTTDTDWWRGQCNGKTGYFPASYVLKLYPGHKVMMVTQTMQLTEGEHGIKLCRDQVVVQTGNEVDGTVPIKTGSGRKVYCPLKHLMEV